MPTSPKTPILSPKAASPNGFTLVELLVVVAIIAVLVSVLLPALATARGHARTVSCASNLNQLALGFTMYVQDHGVYPSARWKTPPKTRWPIALDDFLGGSVEDPTRQSTPSTANRIVNGALICPAVSESIYQLPDQDRGAFIRTGSYGYNWATFGPFDPDPSVARTFPVPESAIQVPGATIMLADAFGDSSMSDNIHAYTLDGPVPLNGRWGTNSGGQTPADPRHSRKFNAAFADTHVESLSMIQAGYDSPDPRSVGGTGNPRLWNGLSDSTITDF